MGDGPEPLSLRTNPAPPMASRAGAAGRLSARTIREAEQVLLPYYYYPRCLLYPGIASALFWLAGLTQVPCRGGGSQQGSSPAYWRNDCEVQAETCIIFDEVNEDPQQMILDRRSKPDPRNEVDLDLHGGGDGAWWLSSSALPLDCMQLAN